MTSPPSEQGLSVEKLLLDPKVVHLNMLRGGIAKLTPEQIGHLYRGDEARAVIAELERQNGFLASRSSPDGKQEGKQEDGSSGGRSACAQTRTPAPRRAGKERLLDAHGDPVYSHIGFEIMYEDADGWSEWIHPLPGHRTACCRCDLIHEWEYQIVASNGDGRGFNPGEGDEAVIIKRARTNPAESGDGVASGQGTLPPADPIPSPTSEPSAAGDP